MARLLPLTGLSGIMAFAVTQRTHEIGMRLDQGASRGTALRMILRDVFTAVATGTAVALPRV